MWRRLWCDEGGQTALEYGLVVSLLAMLAITVATVLGRQERLAQALASDSRRHGSA
ncbi:MAG: hypothetical protein IT204_23600 [Fimbriimonadaceae bacterium]|nr:hypothetical protein [Fimbriimonadaceae bacterium]